jgi:hypothetical protein
MDPPPQSIWELGYGNDESSAHQRMVRIIGLVVLVSSILSVGSMLIGPFGFYFPSIFPNTIRFLNLPLVIWHAIGSIVNIMGIFAGAFCVSNALRGRKMLIVWAYANLATVVIYVGVGVVAQVFFLHRNQLSPLSMVISTILGMFASLGLPVLVLLILRRPRSQVPFAKAL